MNARRHLIAALSEDSLGGIATLADVAHAEQLVDAYRAEILAEAKIEVVAWLVKKAAEGTPIGDLASKVDRGAVRAFLGTGHYRDAMDAHRSRVLNEAADYVEQRRLARADIVTDFDRGRRAAEGCVVEELRELAGEEATAAAATATPDEKFFVPGRVYTRTNRLGLHLRFVCEHLTTDPKVGDREAWGWLHRSDGTRRMERLWDHDYPRWTEAGEGRG
ncbi:hypothetical protein [Streptomyces stelliscabiei]|uniref:Uncharacterized protein n=1 Tax=Streptomyces stelliscabiei TaxID=146820 RepID=A0A8I0TR55_9ACTN|nr:hypothetical protein [Streptomyces stelliscabiei]KND45303.1 hypothetical protein IQ64_07690 [Streptomyces stelliscabiei]MBE1597142.1 hypothetical protein [Streptomyces stelliscabiei]